jgi:hypothetical protein
MWQELVIGVMKRTSFWHSPGETTKEQSDSTAGLLAGKSYFFIAKENNLLLKLVAAKK